MMVTLRINVAKTLTGSQNELNLTARAFVSAQTTQLHSHRCKYFGCLYIALKHFRFNLQACSSQNNTFLSVGACNWFQTS